MSCQITYHPPIVENRTFLSRLKKKIPPCEISSSGPYGCRCSQPDSGAIIQVYKKRSSAIYSDISSLLVIIPKHDFLTTFASPNTPF